MTGKGLLLAQPAPTGSASHLYFHLYFHLFIDQRTPRCSSTSPLPNWSYLPGAMPQTRVPSELITPQNTPDQGHLLSSLQSRGIKASRDHQTHQIITTTIIKHATCSCWCSSALCRVGAALITGAVPDWPRVYRGNFVPPITESQNQPHEGHGGFHPRGLPGFCPR